jgi:hypothetical protein
MLRITQEDMLGVARTSSQADDADKPLVGGSNGAMGDFEYML